MKDTYNGNTTAKIKGKEYNVSILLRDFDKAEEYNKKRKEHNNKVDGKQIHYALFASCSFVGAFISMINIDNYGFLKVAFLILSMLSVLFGYLFLQEINKYEYSDEEKILYEASNLKFFLECSDITENLFINIDSNCFTISAIEKDTKILKHRSFYRADIEYYNQDYVLIESFLTEETVQLKPLESTEINYNFRVLLPLDLYKE